MTDIFDPEVYLNATTTEANDTKLSPVPEGDYPATVKEVTFKTWAKRDDPSVRGLKLALTWDINSPAVAETLGRTSLTCRQEIMLDLTDSGAIDFGKGKNVALGRLREATGLNSPGQPFSPNMLPGRQALVHVSHRTYEDSIFDEIKRVAKLA